VPPSIFILTGNKSIWRFVTYCHFRLFKAIQRSADRINFIIGGSSNHGHADIAFKQQGIMPRYKVITLIAQKLRSEGRLVDIKQV
jgi:hypothetical protein